MKKLLLIPLFLFCISAFGQFTKPQLYTGINTNIRLKTASQSRLAAMLDSLVSSMSLVLTNGSGTTANGSAVDLGGTQNGNISIIPDVDATRNFQFGDATHFLNTFTIYGATYVNNYLEVNGANAYLQVNGSISNSGNSTESFYATFSDGVDNTLINAQHDQINLTHRTGRFLRFNNFGLELSLGSDANEDSYVRRGGYLTRIPVGSNGQVWTVTGGTVGWAAPSGGGLTVGTSTITSGTNTRVLYNNSGVLGEYTVSGSGNVAMTTSPVFTTPNIGVATGTASGNWFGTGTTTLTGAVYIVGTSSNTIKYTFAGLGTTQTDGAGLHFRNTTAAAAGAQQISPSIVLEGQGWKTNATAASQSVKYIMDVLPVQGAANPTGTFRLGYSINGAAITYPVTFDQSNSYFSAPNIIATSGTIQLNSTRLLLFNGGTGTIAADANSQLAFRSNASTSAIVFNRFYNTSGNFTATSGTQTIIGNETSFAPTSGTAIFNAYLGSGTINQTGGANGVVSLLKLTPTYTATGGDVNGLFYDPTVTSVGGVNYFLHATSGKILVGGSTITSNTHFDFRGGSSTDKILRIADGSNNELFTFKADKEYEVTQTNGKYQERHPTGTTSATVYSENIYSSSDISDGQSVTIEVLWTAKDSGANTGAGGIFYTTWTKASGTLAKAGDNQLVTNDNMTGSWALSTSDSGGSIALAFTGTGVANTEISLVTRIIKSN